MDPVISLSFFEAMSFFAALLSGLTIPLILYIWRNTMGRIEKLEQDSERSITRIDHSNDIKRIEHSVERIEKKVEDGFSEMNVRIDNLMTLLIKQGIKL